MRFELDKTLIDDILFHMENQDGDFLLDIQEGFVINTNNIDSFDEEIDYSDNDRFISIPDWSSADGYRLMERFTASLKNPVLREELSNALNRNRGVFRAFRDALSQYPESEKQWYSFKDKEMEKEVIAWYNSLREEWGLEPIGSEPEDNTAVVLEDFLINEQLTMNNEKVKVSFIAETANGDSAGLISAIIKDSILYIDKLSVETEYRGMGIGKILLAKMLEKADAQGLDVQIDLPAESEFFARALLLEEFKPVMQRFVRKRGIE